MERFEAPIQGLEYLAISHVWGNPSLLAPRDIAGIEGRVLCTPEKAKYIEQELPKMVGSKPFWMDILTVNQTDKDAVTAITGFIPALFRNASCTIVLRECDGFYDCCREAVQGFGDYRSFLEKMIPHHRAHQGHVRVESYLQRLWTLQECLLSATVQFTISSNGKWQLQCSSCDGSGVSDRYSDTPRELKGADNAATAWYQSQVDTQIICDSLYTLACVFTGADESDISAFLQAYINCATIKKPAANQMDKAVDIHEGNLRLFNLSSPRASTKHRDYVLATMPQFSWYTVPINAKAMSFGDIFQDLYAQASARGHGFAFKILNSMTNATIKTDQERAWLPSSHQPEPQCLGDFLKLMGGAMAESAGPESGPLHITTRVAVREWVKKDNPNTVFGAISNTMTLCRQYFEESHRAGELSKYGNYPSLEWDLDDAEAMRFGWMRMGNRNAVRLVSEGEDTHLVYGGGWDYHEQPDAIFQALHETSEDESPWPGHTHSPPAPEQSEPLLQHARKVLDHMWSGHGDANMAQKSDWRIYKQEMYPQWPEPLIRALMLLTGLMGCGLGLSAAAWANRYFVPVYVHFHSKTLIGLMARHTRSSPSDRGEIRQFWSVGRHHPSTPGTKGKDILLVDPETKLAVGLLPDFLPNMPVTDEVYAERMANLYHGFSKVFPNNSVGILHLRLSALKRAE